MPKIIFVYPDATERTVEAQNGLSILEIARKYDVPLEGDCEGSLTCSTCHVIVAPEWYAKLPPAIEDEEDMLDLAFGLTPTSRLGCQIIMSDALDGLRITLPPEQGLENYRPA
jgi:2Fe-2S ferredoxin